MLGATPSPRKEHGDEALLQLAKNIGKEHCFEAPNVAVFFGEPGKEVKDPYFDGKGPERSGCTFCGGCMLAVKDQLETIHASILNKAQGLPFLVAFTFGEQGCFPDGKSRHGNLMISATVFG